MGATPTPIYVILDFLGKPIDISHRCHATYRKGRSRVAGGGGGGVLAVGGPPNFIKREKV